MIQPQHFDEGLAAKFAANKSIVLDNFLDKEVAEDLYEFLNVRMPPDWWFAQYKNQGSNKDGYNKAQMLRRTPENEQLIQFELEKCHYSNYKNFFSFMFDRTTTHVKGCTCDICEFEKALFTTTFFDLISSISSTQITHKNEFFASKFTAGQFIAPHHDLNKGKLGFVLNLTKSWRPHYGGLLHFLTDDYKHVTKVILPEFNKLTLFHIPEDGGIPHYVSPVNPGVQLNRISFTGWLS